MVVCGGGVGVGCISCFCRGDGSAGGKGGAGGTGVSLVGLARVLLVGACVGGEELVVIGAFCGCGDVLGSAAEVRLLVAVCWVAVGLGDFLSVGLHRNG